MVRTSYNSNGSKARRTLRNCLCYSPSFGTQTRRVGCVFHVYTREDSSPVIQQSRSHSETRVGSVAVFSRRGVSMLESEALPESSDIVASLTKDESAVVAIRDVLRPMWAPMVLCVRQRT